MLVCSGGAVLSRARCLRLGVGVCVCVCECVCVGWLAAGWLAGWLAGGRGGAAAEAKRGRAGPGWLMMMADGSRCRHATNGRYMSTYCSG